ncbi:MAG TPA: hypothetical protein VIE68_06215 [Gemmatimonadota bacterium]|jgi:hypothetical protein
MIRIRSVAALGVGFLAALSPRAIEAQPLEVASLESRVADEPLIWLESLGGSTGDVMKLHVVNPGPDPVAIDGYFALEPVDLTAQERDRIFESVKGAAGNHVEAVISFYCLEFGAAAPAAGVVYRIAPRAAQEAFAPAARALEVARRLNDAGLLSPDTNPESYFHSIRQWSIWTLEKGFDREGFLSAFAEHTRKNAEARGMEWTDAVAQAVRTSAEGRWRDVAKILEEAGRSGAGSR